MLFCQMWCLGFLVSCICELSNGCMVMVQVFCVCCFCLLLLMNRWVWVYVGSGVFISCLVGYSVEQFKVVFVWCSFVSKLCRLCGRGCFCCMLVRVVIDMLRFWFVCLMVWVSSGWGDSFVKIWQLFFIVVCIVVVNCIVLCRLFIQ